MTNLNAGSDEGAAPTPGRFSLGPVEADTAKDFVWEISRACPAARPYLERLVLADQIVAAAARGGDDHSELRQQLIARWDRLRKTT